MTQPHMGIGIAGIDLDGAPKMSFGFPERISTPFYPAEGSVRLRQVRVEFERQLGVRPGPLNVLCRALTGGTSAQSGGNGQ
jgi:hypothetical protein